LEARFESRILPLFVRRSEEVGALLPELYLHGLAMGDFEFAWRKDLDGRDLAGATIRRKLAALSSLFEHLCEANAVTHNQ
jgi:hypothetical protein